ncbi:cytochrome c maturation protein CcmE [Nitrospinae bacterium AH_259_B05_G02_I21]|nr:cytochrome c maturation protein CcmE [Nitrospinae bacterium AH_259_B05_G02_I21]
MNPRRRRLFIALAVVVAALGYLAYTSMPQALVYFVTPSELVGQGPKAYGHYVRLGGLVVEGSVQRKPEELEIIFGITDGLETITVSHVGVVPDLFGEGRGAVVEGALTEPGLFEAQTIMAKHAEEYKPPSGESRLSPEEFYRSILGREPPSNARDR